MKTWWTWLLVGLGCLVAMGGVWAAEEKGSVPGASEPAAAAPAAAAPATPASAGVPMEQTPHWSIVYLGAAASAGVIILGAAYGIAKIGASAVENMARQPEVAGSINTAMIVSAALIEGVTFFALIVCLLSVFFK